MALLHFMGSPHTSKSYERILMKFSGNVHKGSRNKWLDFRGDGMTHLQFRGAHISQKVMNGFWWSFQVLCKKGLEQVIRIWVWWNTYRLCGASDAVCIPLPISWPKPTARWIWNLLTAWRRSALSECFLVGKCERKAICDFLKTWHPRNGPVMSFEATKKKTKTNLRQTRKHSESTDLRQAVRRFQIHLALGFV